MRLLNNRRQVQTGPTGKTILMPVLVLLRMFFLMESMPRQSISLGKIPSPDTHIHYFGDSRYVINNILWTPFLPYPLSIMN